MAKNAVYNVEDIFGMTFDPLVKKAALAFDTIYFEEVRPYREKTMANFDSHPVVDALARKEKALLNYLLDQKVLTPFELSSIVDENKVGADSEELLNRSAWFTLRRLEMDRILEEEAYLQDPVELGKNLQYFWVKASDSMTRFMANRLNKLGPEEFYPILRSEESFCGEGTKAEVIRLVLNGLPQPTEDTPWQSIIDFRKDEETRRQYLALLNWINEMGRSSLSINEISEKLEWLFLEYKRSIERHRLKWGTGMLEILVAAGIGVFTGNLPTALNLASNLIKVGSTIVNLREEEGKMPGKEIAYIYHVNKTF